MIIAVVTLFHYTYNDKYTSFIFYMTDIFGLFAFFCYLCKLNMKEQKPLVSFILPYYNLPIQMLCECINSILALSLTPQEREIIVVDDGSEISPMNGLMQYDNDIIYLRQKNGGLSSARNKGIEVAKGQYLQFVDTDDYLIKDEYDCCLDILRKHPDTDIVMFDYTSTSSAQSFTHDTMSLSGTELMHHHNIHGAAWGYLFRAKTLSELRFTPGIFHEDEEFTPQLLIRAERVIVTKLPAYYYRQRNNSIMTSSATDDTNKRLDDCHGVILRLQLLSDRLPQNDRLAMQRRVAQLSMDYLYQIIMQTRSHTELENRIETLRSEGLFPLPNRSYTLKYQWFRRMTSTSLGRRILLNTLPVLKKEK